MKPTSKAIQHAARGNRGQAMTEYIIIVVLAAITLIGMVGIFGNQLRDIFGTSSDALAGADNAGSTDGPACAPETNKGPGPGLRMKEE
jgi:Flp pilus assembly pilin Flp